MKKTYFAAIAGGFAISAVVMDGGRLQAQVGSTGSSRIPLSSLAGSFAGKGNSKVAICFNENFTAVQSCSRTPQAQIVSFVENSKSHATVDIKGGACAEVREISAPEPPGRLSTTVNNYIAVGVTTFYNPDTGSGDVSYEFYISKPGVTCNGATFINTAKAPVKFAELLTSWSQKTETVLMWSFKPFIRSRLILYLVSWRMGLRCVSDRLERGGRVACSLPRCSRQDSCEK